MKRENIPNFLQLIALILLMIACFYGLLYIFKGETMYSFAIALIIAIILGLTVFAMNTMKTKGRNTGFTFLEGVCLFLYAIAGLFSFLFLIHYWNVERLYKQDIVNAANAKLKVLTTMQVDYETQVNDYSTSLENSIQADINNHTFSSTSSINKLKSDLGKYNINTDNINKSTRKAEVEEKKNTKIENIKDFVLSDFDDFKKANAEFISNTKPIFDDWEEKYIHDAIQNIDIRLASNFETLKNKMLLIEDDAEYWNKNKFNYILPDSSPIQISDPIALIKNNKKSNLLIPVLIGLVFHFFILLPYISFTRKEKIRTYKKIRKGENTGPELPV